MYGASFVEGIHYSRIYHQDAELASIQRLLRQVRMRCMYFQPS